MTLPMFEKYANGESSIVFNTNFLRLAIGNPVLLSLSIKNKNFYKKISVPEKPGYSGTHVHSSFCALNA